MQRLSTVFSLVLAMAACKTAPPAAPEVEPGSPEVAEKEIKSLLDEAGLLKKKKAN